MIMMENAHSYVVFTKYGPMMFFKNDDPIGTCLIAYGEWAQQEFDVISQLVTPNTNCIDIGANIGTHSVWLSRNCMNGVIFSIEPQFYIFNFLITNLMLNDCMNCFASKSFISNVDTTFINAPVMRPISDKFNYGEFNMSLCSNNGNGVPTKIVRLDEIEYVDNYHIGFIKMDCEGVEDAVLKSGYKTITKNKPNLYIEYNGIKGNQPVIDVLNDYGYNCYWHVYPKFNVNNHNKSNINVYLYEHEIGVMPNITNASRIFESNLICVHKDKDEGIFQDKIQHEDNIIKWLLRNNWITDIQ